MKKQQNNTPVMAPQPQVETLLRLKRSENPDAQFWERFEAELHQRMLRTLVQKEPWYRQLYYASLRPKVQLFFTASLATVGVCVFGWPLADTVAPQLRVATSEVVVNDEMGEPALLDPMGERPVIATHMFDFASSFALAGGFEDAQEFTLGTPSRQKSGLDSMTF
jgi:ribosomal protein S10